MQKRLWAISFLFMIMGSSRANAGTIITFSIPNVGETDVYSFASGAPTLNIILDDATLDAGLVTHLGLGTHIATAYLDILDTNTNELDHMAFQDDIVVGHSMVGLPGGGQGQEFDISYQTVKWTYTEGPLPNLP
jgi:hypothetical protein